VALADTLAADALIHIPSIAFCVTDSRSFPFHALDKGFLPSALKSPLLSSALLRNATPALSVRNYVNKAQTTEFEYEIEGTMPRFRFLNQVAFS
jgi:hypothetical protein